MAPLAPRPNADSALTLDQASQLTEAAIEAARGEIARYTGLLDACYPPPQPYDVAAAKVRAAADLQRAESAYRPARALVREWAFGGDRPDLELWVISVGTLRDLAAMYSEGADVMAHGQPSRWGSWWSGAG